MSISSFLNPQSIVVIVLGISFMLIFKLPISNLIKKIKFNFRKNGLGVSNQKEGSKDKKLKEIYKKLKIKSPEELNTIQEDYSGQISASRSRETQIFNLWKYYMFLYLDIFLVPNTKSALMWFFNNSSSTKSLFSTVFELPANIEDIDAQKEIIFNVLLNNALIIKSDSDQYMITDLGRDFLRHIGYLSN